MQPTRRRMLTMTGAVAAALTAQPLFAYSAPAQSRPAAPQPMASPNAPANENVPVGLDGAEIPVNGGGRAIPPATWLEIKSDAQKLFDMATDFKTRVDRTNLAATLSLPLLQEAHNIEKLAKHIQSRMKS
ncbi:MAG: hypothetical protein WA634_05240 [Silvibacterium sp.]